MVKLFEQMFESQRKLNDMINPNWKEDQHDWNLAITQEVAEMIESIGYKWWKKIEPDYDNIKVELVDIMHFLISKDMSDEYYNKVIKVKLIEEIAKTSLNIKPDNKLVFKAKGFAEIAESTIDMHKNLSKHTTNLQTAKGISSSIYSEDSINAIANTIYLWVDIGGTIEDLARAYLIKNLLNIFRQENGYNMGKYVKHWTDAEDNVVVFRLAEKIKTEDLYEELPKQMLKVYKENVT